MQAGERALGLLEVFLNDPTANHDLTTTEIDRQIRTGDSVEDDVVNLAATLAALLEVSRFLLEGWAQSTGIDPEEILTSLQQVIELGKE